ncbi:MAG: hypothetical protein US31_C0013G0004 [Berkelbacteria bacterium GW2011_GWA1_36_9]|uniref:Uncharacterized protein n=1 Tax=Berkelbacteria bacterium GW2011_GWA1_36_9 TaxID=1618331 RepID=A0A0G0IPG8_9BACT|nr:MAG: hypothetical protein US31_C0013G0004 [Berkelbacteria bacterium GW2011_GWA1_36_9]
MENLKPHSKSIRMFYFWSGIIATIAYRIIIVFSDIQMFWIKFFWYIGTIGFVIYFVHRYQISEKRTQLIKQHDLEQKVAQLNEVTSDDKEALNYIIKSLGVSHERWNYIIIFVSSALALLAGIYLDFIK